MRGCGREEDDGSTTAVAVARGGLGADVGQAAKRGAAARSPFSAFFRNLMMGNDGLAPPGGPADRDDGGGGDPTEGFVFIL